MTVAGSFNVVPQAPMSGPRRGGPARPNAAGGGVRPQQPQQPLFSDIGQGDFLNNVAQITDNPLLRYYLRGSSSLLATELSSLLLPFPLLQGGP